MGSTDNMKTKLEQIPNNVSGDGKSFVAQLKRFLKCFRDDTDKKIDDIGAGAVEQVFGLKLTEEHEYDSKGNPVNNIFVEFDNTNVSDYLNAQVWMKKSTENAYKLVGTTSNVTYTITDVLAGATYYVKVIACSKHAGTSDFDTAPVEDITIRGSVLVPAAPTQFYLTFDDEGPKWEWKFVDNGYVDFFELRMDGHAGVWSNNRLDSTRNDFSRVPPPVRSGTAYLFIRNIYGMYSQPATHTFNIVAPSKPTKPTMEFTIDGVVITMAALPTGCINYLVEVTDFENHVEVFETKNSQFTYFQFSGTIKARYAFVDSSGQGPWSDLVTGNITHLVDSDRLADSAVVENKIAANAVTAGKIKANTITSDKLYTGSVEANKIKAEHIYSGTTEADRIQANNIAAGSIITDKLAANAVTSAKIYAGNVDALRIQSDNIAAGVITAQKIYSGNVEANKIQTNNIASEAVTTDKLKAGAVTAGKISVDNLAAVSADVGDLTGGTITGTTLIGSTIRNSTNTFSVDADGNIRGASLLSGTINADMIYQAGYKVKNITFLTGIINIPRTSDAWYEIPRPNGYTAAECISTAYATVNPNVASGNAYCTVDVDMDQNGITRVKLREIHNQPQDITNIPVRYKTIGIK